MSKVLQRTDKQGDIVDRREQIRQIINQIENESEDLKVVAFMEHTTPPETVKPKVIKFQQVIKLLRVLAEDNPIEKGVAKVMFYSPSTGRSRGLTPTMMPGFQYIKAGMQTKPHSHNMASVYLVVKGKGYSIVDGKKLEWEEGDVFVVPANMVHYHVNTSKEDAVLFDVTDSGLLENLGILEFREE
ncbi:cupin domain-containing protein [Stygiolobus caldivivus]|uniref:Cupin n=1 Tax=Stygiolobus caldivivus TaxID=2824673 RepID=A0A8D5U883_9CREN|nr:cupin domain-containing protein [Stygiolobus caldivivus]BCU71411.1 cupin [Stygiolobus caldivivus]